MACGQVFRASSTGCMPQTISAWECVRDLFFLILLLERDFCEEDRAIGFVKYQAFSIDELDADTHRACIILIYPGTVVSAGLFIIAARLSGSPDRPRLFLLLSAIIMDFITLTARSTVSFIMT
jgi:hypothetical protein